MFLSPATVLVKTAEGRNQIEKRTIKIPPKLRQLFLMIDGVKRVDELLAMRFFAGLGLESFQELVDLGLIAGTSSEGPLDISPQLQNPGMESGHYIPITLSECRYKIVDTLLNTCGFSARDWIDKLESVQSLADMQGIVREMLHSKLITDPAVKTNIAVAAGIRWP